MLRTFSAPKGKQIFQPGQACPGFVILSEGTIRVTLTGPSGREVVLYRVRPGEVCLQTLSCLINDVPYAAEGVAESDLAGELVPTQDFRTRFAEDTAFRDTVMASISKSFAEYQQLIEDVALTGFDARLAKVLLRLTGPDGRVTVSHAELARETASGRAYVTRRLAAFAADGFVLQDSDGISITNRAALEHLAAGER